MVPQARNVSNTIMPDRERVARCLKLVQRSARLYVSIAPSVPYAAETIIYRFEGDDKIPGPVSPLMMDRAAKAAMLCDPTPAKMQQPLKIIGPGGDIMHISGAGAPAAAVRRRHRAEIASLWRHPLRFRASLLTTRRSPARYAIALGPPTVGPSLA